VAHSLSPVLHRAAYLALGLTDWRYDAVECGEHELAGLLARSGPEVVGYSCTMPLKRVSLSVADAVSEDAAAIGAANTLLRVEDDWFADNTDWVGIRDCMAERGIATTGRVALIGAGGTAQAALAALPDAQDVVVLVRAPSRAAALLETAARLGPAVGGPTRRCSTRSMTRGRPRWPARLGGPGRRWSAGRPCCCTRRCGRSSS
jgi:shikimate dehydrogenase